jgi:hypothetical protein
MDEKLRLTCLKLELDEFKKSLEKEYNKENRPPVKEGDDGKSVLAPPRFLESNIFVAMKAHEYGKSPELIQYLLELIKEESKEDMQSIQELERRHARDGTTVERILEEDTLRNDRLLQEIAQQEQKNAPYLYDGVEHKEV